MVIDVEEKLKAGKGRGFETWAKDYNLKMLAKSVAYIREHNIETFDVLAQLVINADAHQEARAQSFMRVIFFSFQARPPFPGSSSA